MGKKSKAWDYFIVTTSKDKAGGDCPAGKCKFCKEVILTKDYTTTPLIGHLQANHPTEYHIVRADIDAKKAAKAKKVQDKDAAAAAAGVHDPIPSTSRGSGRAPGTPAPATAPVGIHKFPMMSAEQLKLDMEVTKFIARTNSSFALVESDAWKELMSHLCPRMNVKHRTTYGGAKLNVLYDQLMSVRDDLLLTELPGVSTVAITFDHWSSRNNDPFIVVTAHYINKDFILRKLTLGLLHHPDRHTAERIAHYLDTLVENIPPLTQCTVVATIDQARNMKAALRLSKSVSGVDDISLLCADHMLNTCVQRACEDPKTDPRIVSAIQRARAVCSKLHQSFKSEDIVIQTCRNLRMTYKKIPSPSPTRWNSHEMMFAGVVELEAALVRASQDNEFGCEVPSAENFKLLKALLPILSLIRKVSELLSGDERPTMDQALLQIFLLRSMVVKTLVAARVAKDASGQVEFLVALLAQLDQRFINCGGEFHQYKLGHLLHPFHKGLLLKRLPTPVFDETVQELVSDHPTTAVYKQNSLDNASQAHEKTNSSRFGHR